MTDAERILNELILNVGKVTAYADAVAGGYTGTREEWEEALAGIGSEAAAALAAKNAAEAAQTAAETAQSAAETAGNAAEAAASSAADDASDAHIDALAATAAKEAAETAQLLAEDAKASAIAAKGAAETAQDKAEDAQEAAEAAQTAAETAQAAAETAETNAETAQTGAETARAAAEAVLESIPEDYSELSSDVTDLKSAIEPLTPINLTQNQELTSGLIKWANGEFASSTSSVVTDYIDISNIETILYTRVISTASRTPTSGMAFYDATKSYISGESFVSGGTQYSYALSEKAVPPTAKYARFTWFASFGQFELYDLEQYNDSLQKQYESYEETTTEKLNFYDANLISIEDADLGVAPVYSTVISSTNGTWVNNANFKSYFIPVSKDIYDVRLTANSNAYTVYAFLKSYSYPSTGVPDYAEGSKRSALAPGTSVTVKRPDDATILYVLKNDQNTDYTPSSIKFSKFNIDTSNQVLPLGLHTKPENNGVLNLIKRCRQLTDIKWTPAVDLPRYMYVSTTPPSGNGYSTADAKHYLGTFKAGVEYTGVPYGWADFITGYGYETSFVGLDVDFETFVTAIQNPESIISKEQNGSVSQHRSVQYAAICSALVSYALGLNTLYDTSRVPTIPGLNLVTPLKVNNEYVSPSVIRLGDIINLSGYHTAVITDIVKDAEGNVIFIEESEATTVGEGNPSVIGGQKGGVCRRVGFSVEEFFLRYGSYSLYRYANIADIQYNPSKYVNVGDELNMFITVNLPCLPYMGEGFKYKAGYIPSTEICVTTDEYAYLRVYKDGTEITGSPFAVTPSVGYVETGFASVGNYEAYLCNMSNGENTSVTAKCHWSVIE